ncbi:hypothetical protein ACK3ZE_04380 [Aeromonas caviae]|uniref:hypothetical protein n=1 Tax=Aeromonas TaxID=642 RepID=UPI0011185AD6|nr:MULTISPECIES: hypothetical protein [Aeromonas]MDX7946141.1 hypothetical protein [Aeromonas caviae]BBT21473.1 hypothetical protein WP8S17E03_18980 [Aeromonas caviae]DAL99434.1 MAG TPA: G-rich domain on putative tyrosine kinase [Inoviridae sp.]
MNKNKKDYIYNPKLFRRPRGSSSSPTPLPLTPSVKPGNAAFLVGLMLGFMAGFILAKLI